MADESIPTRALTGDASFLSEVDADVPLAYAKRIDGWALNDAYRQAEKVSEKAGDEKAKSVFGSIATLCSAAPNPYGAETAYRPMITDGNRRSFIPEDLEPADFPFVAAVAEATSSPWLQARLIDYLFLKRARVDLWPKGINAYIEAAAEGLKKNPRDGVRCLERGVDLARRILGKGKPEEVRIRGEAATHIRASIRSLEPREGTELLRIAAEKKLLEEAELAILATELAESYTTRLQYQFARECWIVASIALNRSGNEAGGAAAALKSAQTFEAEADMLLSTGTSARAAANDLLVRGIQAMREARAPQGDIQRLSVKLSESQQVGLRERVAARSAEWDNQERVPNPLEKTLHDDIRQSTERATAFVKGMPWNVALARLALGHALKAPEEYRELVIRLVDEAPLMSFITREKEDNKGRTSFRDARWSILRGDFTEEQMLNAQCESARLDWEILCASFIEPCRRQIAEEHEITRSDWEAVVRFNPIVPRDHAFAIMRGLHSGLVGDWVVSAHILAVKVEAILRHVLSEKGIDTTTIETDFTQSEKMTGGLLALAERHSALPENLLFAIRVVLTEKAGFSIRHQIAHGLATDGDCFEAACISLWWLVLHMCAHAPELMNKTEPPQPPNVE